MASVTIKYSYEQVYTSVADKTITVQVLAGSDGGGGGVTNHSELVLDDGTNPHGTTFDDIITQTNSFFQWKKSSTLLIKNAFTRVTLDLKDFDDDELFDGAVFTAKKRGIYHVGGAFTIQSLQDGRKMVVWAYKNGLRTYMIGRGTSGGTDFAGYSGSFYTYLEVGDKIEVRILQTNTINTRLASAEKGYNYFFSKLIKEL